MFAGDKGVAMWGGEKREILPKPKRIVVENGIISEGSIFINKFSKTS